MKYTILLVDDDRNVLNSLRRALRKEPFEIIVAETGEEALGLLEGCNVDVVVSDEEMPGMSGTTLLGFVRQKYPETIRFILTGKATVHNALEAINKSGVTRFFIKPCDSIELAVAIRQGLEQRELLLAARKLLQKTKRQSRIIENLEKLYPTITRVERDTDGAIPLEDWNGDVDQLMNEICAQLGEGA